ncbi:unnamed protein product [Nezara viridula]|uniref:Uncharacterized protein n=1 Tax=Nezara viridula TaxID=85310 RepID=A0A9P0E564_NEZVI|nr:unnamed protein product [Nezara viridula]CAH1396880.1 unnamed protein product [Nezara viridula]CAH1407397.1 unnamed protein product [Nezara viridula]
MSRPHQLSLIERLLDHSQPKLAAPRLPRLLPSSPPLLPTHLPSLPLLPLSPLISPPPLRLSLLLLSPTLPPSLLLPSPPPFQISNPPIPISLHHQTINLLKML